MYLVLCTVPSDLFQINICIDSGILRGDPLALYLFTIVFDYTLRIEDREGLILTTLRSTRYPASHLSDLDYANDIALFADTMQEAELLLHKILQNPLDYFSVQAKQNTCTSTRANNNIHSSDGSQFEKVEDFQYLES